MTEQEFYAYVSDPHNYERVYVGLDLAQWHLSLEAVFKESIRCGRQKDVDAMKFVIDNNINIGTLGYMHLKIAPTDTKDYQ
jgi:hypothetical protein